MFNKTRVIQIILGLFNMGTIAEHDALEQLNDLCKSNLRAGLLLGFLFGALVELMIHFYLI